MKQPFPEVDKLPPKVHQKSEDLFLIQTVGLLTTLIIIKFPTGQLINQ